jgi:hypothetical protein
MAGEYTPDESIDLVSQRLSPSTGYTVTLPRIRKATWAAVNGWLYAPDGIYMPLFITEYHTSFSLSGTTGQSQMVRDFYPRNFVQPDFVLTGQSPNQHYYNRLGEFIRYFQRKSVTTADPGRLVVPDGGASPVGRNPSVSMRGLNKGFVAEGYVEDIERGGEQGQFAPDWSFEFKVSVMRTGLYHEDHVEIHQLKSWAEIFRDEKHAWETDPDVIAERQEDKRDKEERDTLLQGWQWFSEFLGLKR